jgi:oligopeptide transport system substrate-binding protein
MTAEVRYPIERTCDPATVGTFAIPPAWKGAMMNAATVLAGRARLVAVLLLVSLFMPGLTVARVRGEEATPAATAAQAHVLRIGRVGLPPTYDPHTNDWSFVVPSFAYEGLTKLDQDMNVVPGAAESWEFSDDGLTVTFHLRDGLRYNDGSPLTAERFRYAVERSCDAQTEAPYVNFIFVIAGCEAFATSLPASEEEEGTPAATPEADALAAYEAARANLGVRAPDDSTLEVDLVDPAGYLPALAATWLFYPVPQEVVEADPAEWWRDPANWVSNGPFSVDAIAFESDSAGREVHFVPNEHYWGYEGARPRLNEVVYRYYESDEDSLAAYLRGELEVSRVPYPYGGQPEIADDPQLRQELLRIPAPATIGFGMDQNVEPFQDKHVREAFAYGLDREGFCRDVWSGACMPALSWIPAGVPGHLDTDAFAFDPEAARRALATSSYGRAENLPEVTYRYGVGNTEDQAVAEWVAENYRKSLGIEITLLPTTDEEFEALDEAGAVRQFSWWDWSEDYADPQNWLSRVWTCETGDFEPLGYCDPRFDELVKQADQETDQDARMRLYSEAQQLLIADVPMAIGFQDTNALIVKPYVTGYTLSPQDFWPGYSSLLTVDVDPAAVAPVATPTP